MPELIENQFEIQSEEMQEIIGKVPHWITRWGISILFIVALIGLLISSIVKYPEVIHASIVIQSAEQPGKVGLRREDASQQFLFKVEDGQRVMPGDTLFIHKYSKKNIDEPVITPMKGTVYITKGVDQNNTQDYTIWVVPETASFEIKVNYPVKGSGKVKEGQNVIIRLTDYPTDEFGFLEAQISRILPVPVDNEYQAYARIKSDDLTTSLGVKLPIQHIMVGSGEIILEEKSILKRIFKSII